MIVDDVNIVKHRRTRTSQHYGFEAASINITSFEVLEQDDDKIVFQVLDTYGT